MSSSQRKNTQRGKGKDSGAPMPPVLVERIASEGQDFADVPMLREPGHVSGRQAAQFSPASLYALTRVERTDVDVDDADLWLTEEPLRTVHKGRIELFGQRFVDDRLAHYTTGPKGSPRPDLVIRYNRALLARGVLDEVKVLRRLDGGRYEEICRARPEAEYVGRTDWAEVIRARNERVHELLGKRAVREHEYVALESGTEALEKLMNEQLARERLRRKVRRDPIVAAPIYAPTEEELAEQAKQEAFRTALATTGGRSMGVAPESEEATKKSARRRKGATSKRTLAAKQEEAPRPAGNSAPITSDRAAEEADSALTLAEDPAARGGSSLGRALGGKTGFGIGSLKRVP